MNFRFPQLLKEVIANSIDAIIYCPSIVPDMIDISVHSSFWYHFIYYLRKDIMINWLMLRECIFRIFYIIENIKWYMNVLLGFTWETVQQAQKTPLKTVDVSTTSNCNNRWVTFWIISNSSLNWYRWFICPSFTILCSNAEEWNILTEWMLHI